MGAGAPGFRAWHSVLPQRAAAATIAGLARPATRTCVHMHTGGLAASDRQGLWCSKHGGTLLYVDHRGVMSDA